MLSWTHTVGLSWYQRHIDLYDIRYRSVWSILRWMYSIISGRLVIEDIVPSHMVGESEAV